MSDKDDKKREQERQRERDMDAEIFGKTMGFVYQKDSEDFQKTVVLKHPHAPGLNREAEEAARPTPPQAARPTPPQAAKPTPPQAAKPTPPQAAKPTPPQAARPTPPQPAKPAAPQAARPTPPQPAKPAAPQAAKPTPPQPAKPAAPQAAKPTPPQPAKPAAPQAAKPTPPQPAKQPETEAFDLGTDLSLEELDEFLLPSELEETGNEPVAARAAAQVAEPESVAEELDLLDFSELDASLLEEVDTAAPEPSRAPVSEDDELMAALDELANETAELEKEEAPAAKPKKPAGAELPDLDLETGDFTTTLGSELLAEEPATTAPTTGKVLLTEADELPEAAAGLEENEFLLVEEPAPAVTEDSLSREPLFQEPYEEEEELDTIGAAVTEEAAAIEEAERDFITTKPDDLTEEPAFQPAPTPAPAVSQPAAKPRGSGFAVFLALLGIVAAGGVGWLTLQTMDRIDQLEARVAALSGHGQSNAVNASQDQAINALKAQTADLEQQLGSLTGVVSNLAAKNNKRNSRPTPKPAKPKAAPAPKPAPTHSAVPAAASPEAAAAGSDWVINLTSVASETAALEEVQHLKEQGVEAESVRVEIDGKPWYRIRVGSFPNEEAANVRKDELSRQLGIHDAWVSHR